MTWVIGFNGFNGVLCLTDIQVTFSFPNTTRKPIYKDCLKKLHKLWDNAYIAFSGDVHIGLSMISDLQENIATNHRPGEIFTLEDRLTIMQDLLREMYAYYANGKTPELELMLAYVHQPEDNIKFEPALFRFIAPDFRFNASGLLQLDQCGSGIRSEELRVISEFLSGRRHPNEKIFNNIFPGINEIPQIHTIKKARTLLTSEAALAGFPGVSSAFFSVIAEIAFNKVWSPEDHKMISSVTKEMGVVKSTVNTRADKIITHEINLDAINTKLGSMSITNPSKYKQLYSDFYELMNRADYNAVLQPPKFEEKFHKNNSAVEENSLCKSWPEMVYYMRSIGLRADACAAIA